MAWYERFPGRLLKEKEIMSDSFPYARLTKLRSGLLAWNITLTSNRGNHYRTLIVYPAVFPSSYPLAYILEPRIKNGTPHIYSDGHLCLFNAGDRPEKSYIPEKTTAATITAWVSAWIFTYENYLRTGRWIERRI